MARPAKGYRTEDGVRVPGVTTIAGMCKPAAPLMHWAWQLGIDGKDYREERDSAASLGSTVHDLVELAMKGEQPTLPDGERADEIREGYEGYLDWARSYKFEVEQTEVSLVSEKHRFGGTFDFVGTTAGHLVCGDLKTSNGTYPEQVLQVAAYAGLWLEHNPDRPVERVLILRVGKDHGDFHVHTYPQRVIMGCWETFLLLRQVYENMKDIKKLTA